MLKFLAHGLTLNSLIALCFLGNIAQPMILQAQTPPKGSGNAQPAQPTPAQGEETDDPSDPNNLRPLTQADSLLSLQGGEKLMAEATEAINKENYGLAATKLQQARKIFNQLSNFHLQLANSFSGIDTKIYDTQRTNALKTGQMRDSATYQLALVHRAQNQPELAVPLLIQVIRSQNPTTDLGKKSYQQLYELGFVDVPLSGSSTATTPTPPQTNPK
jgi:thioredoxin-like negative regulator of GroEL